MAGGDVHMHATLQPCKQVKKGTVMIYAIVLKTTSDKEPLHPGEKRLKVLEQSTNCFVLL